MQQPTGSQEEEKVDSLIMSLKARNAGYQEIMTALLPYIQDKSLPKTCELKLTYFITELIEQRKEQNMRQQILQEASGQPGSQGLDMGGQSSLDLGGQVFNPGAAMIKTEEQYSSLIKQQDIPEANNNFGA